MKSVILEEKDIYSGCLILINRSQPFRGDEKAVMQKLAPAHADYPDVLLEAKASYMLSQLMRELGIKDAIVPVSGFRSVQEQRAIFESSMKENGEAFTLKYVALPGHSEHQTGLAIDLAEKAGDIDFIRPHFPYTGICQSFRELSSKYGFIERYQAGKEAITGIGHEPWHFRYVGYPHSELIHQNSLTLEEYIDFIQDYPYAGKHLRLEDGSRRIDVSYIKASSSSETIVEVQDQIPFHISGNNRDGFIMTEWR